MQGLACWGLNKLIVAAYRDRSTLVMATWPGASAVSGRKDDILSLTTSGHVSSVRYANSSFAC
jgi:hypothetical protein